MERCERCYFWEQELFSENTVGKPEVQFPGYPSAEQVDGMDWVAVGECRRHAPRAGFTIDRENADNDGKHGNRGWPDNAQAAWPITLPLDWCGEFKSK